MARLSRRAHGLLGLVLCTLPAATTAQQTCADGVAAGIGGCSVDSHLNPTSNCDADPCVGSEIGAAGTTCCTGCQMIDFTPEASVANDGCSRCSGPDTADCTVATCATGYHTYSAGTRTCSPCTSQTGCDTSTAGQCSATASGSQPCTSAGVGFYLTSVDVAVNCDTIDFSTVISVVDSGCTACSGGTTAGCTEATCASGYHTYLPSSQACRPCEAQLGCDVSTAGLCSATVMTGQPCTDAADGYYLASTDVATACSTIDFVAVPSVRNSGCTLCTGGAVVDCTVASCATGYHTYSAATQTCAACRDIDFTGVPSVANDGCTACGGGATADCTEVRPPPAAALSAWCAEQCCALAGPCRSRARH